MKQRGFTLIELVMIILLMGIIATVVGRILINSYQAFLTANTISQLEMQNLAVLTRLDNDIHSLDGTSAISSMAASTLVFTKQDGTSASYSLSGTTLSYNSNTLATNVSQFSCGYYTSAGVVTASASTLSYVQVSITSTKGNLSSTLTTMIAIRA